MNHHWLESKNFFIKCSIYIFFTTVQVRLKKYTGKFWGFITVDNINFTDNHFVNMKQNPYKSMESSRKHNYCATC